MNTTSPNPAYAAISQAQEYLQSKIIGQKVLVERLIMALLCDGHLLVEAANQGFKKITLL